MLLKLFICNFVISLSWSQPFHSFGSFEYYWSLEENDYVTSYAEAQQQCSEINATLAVVNEEIRDFLNRTIGIVPNDPFYFYIGLTSNSATTYDQQVWDDENMISDDLESSFVDEPGSGSSSGDENCVTMGLRYSIERGIQWSKLPCDNWNSRYICQRTSTPLPTTTTFHNISDTIEILSTCNVYKILATSLGPLNLIWIGIIIFLVKKQRKCKSSPLQVKPTVYEQILTTISQNQPKLAKESHKIISPAQPIHCEKINSTEQQGKNNCENNTKKRHYENVNEKKHYENINGKKYQNHMKRKSYENVVVGEEIIPYEL